MTQEEKAKAYDEALERIRKELQKCGYTDSDTARQIYRYFPELKESEDKKIRKWIIDDIRYNINNEPLSSSEYKKQAEKAIAWLEEQSDKPQGKSALEAIKEEKVDNQNCVKSADKVNPKFKVGDWVVFDNGNVEHITSVGTHGYTFDDGDYLLHDECDKIAHLWSIQDAKDGDVLCVKYGNDEMPFIFTGKQHDVAYCALNSFGEFVLSMAEWLLKVSVLPATKEQRNALMKVMTDAGYTFDFEKKELKGNEQKSYGQRKECLDCQFNYAGECEGSCQMKRDEQKSVWSEEDERICQCLIRDQEEALDEVRNDKYGHSEIISDLKEMYRERIDWLESLKEKIGG